MPIRLNKTKNYCIRTHLTKIKFLYPNIGYFPQLFKYINHGFSWGKESGNMQFSLGDPVKTRKNLTGFLKVMDMGNIKESINMIPEHKDRIIDINEKTNNTLHSHRFGRGMKCDAFFTTVPNLTLTAKPADCTTAIVYCKNKKGKEVIGIIHSGWRGVEKKLPQKPILHLEKNYKCNPSKIFIGIVPHLSQ